MKIQNLEVGLRRILVATFRSKGLSEAAADAKAARSMAAAVALFHKQLKNPSQLTSFSKHGGLTTTRRADREEHQSPRRTVGFAMHAVRVWAHDLP